MSKRRLPSDHGRRIDKRIEARWAVLEKQRSVTVQRRSRRPEGGAPEGQKGSTAGAAEIPHYTRNARRGQSEVSSKGESREADV